MSTDPHLRARATKLGITVEELAAHIKAGEKWCWRCRRWPLLAEFNRERGQPDGRAMICRQCKREVNKANYIPVPPRPPVPVPESKWKTTPKLCKHCQKPFMVPALAPRARMCSDECRTAALKASTKRSDMRPEVKAKKKASRRIWAKTPKGRALKRDYRKRSQSAKAARKRAKQKYELKLRGEAELAQLTIDARTLEEKIGGK
jgi:hypothetical protein